MRVTMLGMAALAVALVACSGGETPTTSPGSGVSPRFYVVSGDRLFAIDVDDSLLKTRDAVVLAARELWEELQPGESVEFRVEGRSARSVGTDRSHEEREGSVEETAAISWGTKITSTSETYRMFRDRDGASGIEEAPEKPYGLVLRSGPAIGWPEIEEDIVGKVFPALCLDFPARNRWKDRPSEH